MPFLFCAAQVQAPDEIITVEPGNKFVIKLASNRTTGFQWQLAQTLDKNKLQLLRMEYVVANQKVIGGEGKEVWIFKALEPGRAIILLKYVRPWAKEEKPPTTKTFVILIRKAEPLDNIDRWLKAYE